MEIRQANRSDLKKIVSLHIECFKDSFSSQIGNNLLEAYYREFFDKVPELFLVAVDNSRVIGMCMGYYCEDNRYSKQFLQHNFIRLGIKCIELVCKRNKQMLKKINDIKKGTSEKTIIKDENDIPDNCGDILSICVDQEYRGSGIAHKLVESYHNVLKNNNRDVCFLSVRQNNLRAIAFYEKCGYEAIEQIGEIIKMRKQLKKEAS